MRSPLLLAFGFWLLTAPAFAKNWVVDYRNSHLDFVGNQNGKSFDGGFKNFQATIDFDPAHPENGKITATIDTGSAAAGSSDRDSYLPQADWFNVKAFPQAQFISTSIRKTGDNAYIADGTLTIKGISQPVSLPFTLTQDGDHWRAQGKVRLLRNNFHVGEHAWSNEDYVKFAVDVVIDLNAKPQS